jgi:DNA-directed RNA polymerase subunit M/transcription elongation factor TFIIS
MKTCPECGSTEVYFGKVRERLGGLRDEHQVFIPTSLDNLYTETYICVNCGYVRLFLDEKSKKDAVRLIASDKGWTKAE